jgi:hypothetical protein
MARRKQIYLRNIKSANTGLAYKDEKRKLRVRTNKARICIISLGLLAGLTPAAASDQAKWKGMMVKEGDVTVVKNPKDPVYKTPILELRGDFVIGGEAAEAKYVLGRPYDMALDAGENLYVVDGGEKNLKVFDKNGKYVKTLGRPGQGPGEFKFPSGLCILPGAKEVMVFDSPRISVLNLEGAYLRQFPIKGFDVGIQADHHGNFFIATADIRSGQVTLKTYAPDMSRELAVVLSYQEDQGKNAFRPRAYWILDQDGRVVFGESKTYEIRIIDSQGRVLRKIFRDYEPVRVTQEEKDDLVGRTNKFLGAGAAKSMEFSSHHSAYRSFFLADAGRLLVETWERSAEGKQDIYDIFDEEGRYIARAPLNPHPDFFNPRPRFIKNGKLYAIEPDQKGYEVVKRYTVKWIIQNE